MKKNEPYTDTNGEIWIAPARVAEIWNERVKQSGGESNYTRWSVYQRRKKLRRLETPLGDLFSEKEAYEVHLRPHPKRSDVTERNKKRKREPASEN